jgi:NADPH-dependent ferric siderophore reductase
LTLVGDDLGGLKIDEPAASVRLLVPSRGTDELIMPTWNGNEFRLPSGERPLIRTFTPRYLRSDPPELDLDVVLHGGDTGVAVWARKAAPGSQVAVSGPGRGYEIDPDADVLVLLGDETAIPAIFQLLEIISDQVRVVGHIEVADPVAILSPPHHSNATLTWHELPPTDAPGSTLLAAIESEDLGSGVRIWAAGEAAGVQRIRKHLAARGVDRSNATVRGYWKVGRAGPG